MSEYRFSVPGVPVAWQRARRMGDRHFTAPESANWKNKCAVFAANAGVVPIEGAVLVDVLALWPSVKPDLKRDPRPRSYKVTRPDGDNIIKNVCDALNGTAYADDAQVVIATVTKMHAAQGEEPHVEILVRPWSPATVREGGANG